MTAQILNTALGIWLMISPALLDYSGAAATNHYIVGPCVATIAYIAVWEVNRGLRYLNAVAGLWLVLSVWMLQMPPAALWSGLLSGVVIFGLSFVEGKKRHTYAGGWASLVKGRHVPQVHGEPRHFLLNGDAEK